MTAYSPAHHPPLYRFLWLFAALFVVTVPFLASWALDRADRQYQAATALPAPGQRLAQTPDWLTLQLPRTRMEQSHYRNANGAIISRYSNTLSDEQRSLVPFMPRLFNNERYTQTRSEMIDIAGERFQFSSYRNRINGRHTIALHQYRLGPVTTGSYTRAKLYQLPAGLTGTRQFELNIWQMPCAGSECTAERAQLETTVERYLTQQRGPQS